MAQFTRYPFSLMTTFGKLPGLLLLCGLVVACTQAAPTLSPTPPSTGTVAPTQTASPIPATETLAATPLPTAAPTDTPTPTPIPTPTITPTLPPLPITQINKVCITPEAVLLPDFLAEGTIFLYKNLGSENPDQYLSTLNNQEQTLQTLKEIPQIGSYETFYQSVSPNAQYLYYFTRKAQSIKDSAGILIRGDGQLSAETRACRPTWVSNSYVICKGLYPSDIVPAGFTEFTFELLNPFTSEMQNVPVKLPRVYVESGGFIPFSPQLVGRLA